MFRVEGRRGGLWVPVPGEDGLTEWQAVQRADVYRKLIRDAQWRVVPEGRDDHER